MRPAERIAPVLLFVVLSIVVAVLYAPGLRGAYYGDDLMFVRPLHGHYLQPFIQANRETGWYRPVEAALLGAIQDRVGLDTTPIHVLAIALHAAIALLVAGLALRMGLSRGAAVAAAIAFTISQACASAVLGNDTLSQLLATGFGLVSVLLCASAPLGGDRESDVPRALLGSLFLVLAMLSKEAGTGWAGAAALAAVAAARERGGSASRAILPVALVVLVAAGFLLLRTTAGAPPAVMGPGRYDLDPGPGIAIRYSMLIGTTVLPVSTVTIVDAWARGDRLVLAAAGVAEAAMLVCLLIGLLHSRGRGLLLLGGAALALGPVILIHRVSELYAYTAMPFMAVGIGAAVAGAWSATSGARRVVLAISLVGIAGLHVHAIREKAGLAAANGERARVMLGELEAVFRSAPPAGQVLLAEAPSLPRGYSVYRQSGFEPVEDAESFLRSRTGRSDVSVRVVTQAEAETLSSRPGVRAVALAGDRIVPFVSAEPR